MHGSNEVLAPYYAHQGMFFLDCSPSMNTLSASIENFLTEAKGSLIRSGLSLATSPRLSRHVISLIPHLAVMQGEPICRKRGRPLKHGQGSAVSLALLPSTSCPMPIVRPTQKRSSRTGQMLQLVSCDKQDRLWQRMDTRIITIAVGEDVKREILLFARKNCAAAIFAGFGTVSAVNIAPHGSCRVGIRWGYFPILSLVSSYGQNYNSPYGVEGSLNVTFAEPNGYAISGCVGHFMVAVEPVEVA